MLLGVEDIQEKEHKQLFESLLKDNVFRDDTIKFKEFDITSNFNGKKHFITRDDSGDISGYFSLSHNHFTKLSYVGHDLEDVFFTVTYWVREDLRHNGLASDGLKEMLLKEDGTDVVYADIAIDNIGSQKFATSQGFRKVGLTSDGKFYLYKFDKLNEFFSYSEGIPDDLILQLYRNLMWFSPSKVTLGLVEFVEKISNYESFHILNNHFRGPIAYIGVRTGELTRYDNLVEDYKILDFWTSDKYDDLFWDIFSKVDRDCTYYTEIDSNKVIDHNQFSKVAELNDKHLYIGQKEIFEKKIDRSLRDTLTEDKGIIELHDTSSKSLMYYIHKELFKDTYPNSEGLIKDVLDNLSNGGRVFVYVDTRKEQFGYFSLKPNNSVFQLDYLLSDDLDDEKFIDDLLSKYSFDKDVVVMDNEQEVETP